MISDERLTKVLKYLAETDEEAARAEARMHGLEEVKKDTLGLAFLEVDGKNVSERDAKARNSAKYREAVENWENAIADFKLLKNKRSTAALIIEVWRSENANRRTGNIS